MNDRTAQDGHPPAPTAGREAAAMPGNPWRHILAATVQQFGHNQAADLAAMLTYHSVLAVFPALLALVSMMKLSGIGTVLVPQLTQLINEAIPDPDTARVLTGVIEGFFASSGAGVGLIIGIVTSLWTASGYVAAFARVMNRVHSVTEGRHPVKLRLQQLLITALLLLSMLALLGLVLLSGGSARWLGGQLGLDDAVIGVWQVAKWVLMVVIIMLLVAGLYRLTPNARYPACRPVSPGSVLAVLVAMLAVAGFTRYAGHLASFDVTYGALAGAIIGLWLSWLINLAIVAGAHLDQQVLRVRQLQRGLPAETGAIVTPRESTGISRAQRRRTRIIAQGAQIRAGSSTTGMTDTSQPTTRVPAPDHDSPAD